MHCSVLMANIIIIVTGMLKQQPWQQNKNAFPHTHGNLLMNVTATSKHSSRLLWKNLTKGKMSSGRYSILDRKGAQWAKQESVLLGKIHYNNFLFSFLKILFFSLPLFYSIGRQMWIMRWRIGKHNKWKEFRFIRNSFLLHFPLL